MIIDPAGRGEGVADAVEKHRLDVRYVLNTRGYGDTPTSTLEREARENPYITDFILT